MALEDGRELTADLVVMAVGIRPNIDLAKKAGLYCERGVVVSDTLQTYDPSIYAVGECVQHRKQTYGLVAPLFEQAKVCANHLAHFGISRYEGSMTSTKLKVTGIDLFSAGNFTGNDQTEEIVLQDAGAGVYKKVVLKDNRLQGAVMYGDTMDGAWYFQLMRDGTDVSGMRDKLFVRPGAPRRCRSRRHQEPRVVDVGLDRDLRLQRRVQGHDRQDHHRQETLYAR